MTIQHQILTFHIFHTYSTNSRDDFDVVTGVDYGVARRLVSLSLRVIMKHVL